MNTKIIFFDIDGTILSHRTQLISDSTKAAIKQARANGHLTFINTGRTIAEIEKAITGVKFDGYVCGCGTYISYGENVLLQKAIPFEQAQVLIQDFRKYKMEAVLEGTFAIYFNDQSTHPNHNRLRDSHINHNFNVKTWDDRDISFDKFCIWTTSEESISHFIDNHKNSYDFISHWKGFYEVIPNGYSKATGIEFLLSYLNIPHENTYALGDGPNDLTMLNYVKHSIAMGNANEELREKVSFVTEDVDNDGITCALKHYNLI